MYINEALHILNQVFRNKKQLNIICSPTHERWESGLAKTGHNFYAIRGPHIKDWKEQYAPLPLNYTVFSKDLGEEQIPKHLPIDIVLSQNKFGQFQLLAPIAHHFNVPLISLEHTLPVPMWPRERIEQTTQMRGTHNVFITEYSQQKWEWQDNGDTSVITHMVDSNLFKSDSSKERKNHILTVANDYIGREWCLNFSQYKRVCLDNKLPVRPVGDTTGLSLPAKNTEDLINEYQTSRVFFNTAHISPIPTSLLEAMSCGCACVSIRASAISDYITHGVDGFLYDTDKEALEYLQLLLNDAHLAEKMGIAARERMIKQCSPTKFVESWNKVFQHVLGIRL